MPITRKRKNTSSQEEVVRGCKRQQYTHPEKEESEIPHTPRLQKKRIMIRLITPSAPRKIRLRIPVPKGRNVIPYPSPPLESEIGDENVFGACGKFGRVDDGEDIGGLRDVNALLELYCLADGFGWEALKREVLETLEGGEWRGKVMRVSLERCFEDLGMGDGVRRWVVKELVKVWTGGEGLGFVREGEVEDWRWVGEEIREDVLNALRDGEEF